MRAVLPRLLVIADGFTRPSRRDLVLDLALVGVLPWVQLRDHDALPHDFGVCARDLTRDLRRSSPSTLISINGYPELVDELEVGIHLGFRGIAPSAARTELGDQTLIGYSAHSDGEISVIASCDYLTYSPVFPVQKPTVSVPLGLDRLSYMAIRSAKPVFALGGITVERVADCLAAGAYGVAVLSGVMTADDPVGAVTRYLEAIDEYLGIG